MEGGKESELDSSLQPWGCTQESLLVLSHKNLLKGKEKKSLLFKAKGTKHQKKKKLFESDARGVCG